MVLSTPEKKDGTWIHNCACAKSGKIYEGVTRCDSDLAPAVKDKIYENFLEYYKKNDMMGFLDYAGNLTGRHVKVSPKYLSMVNCNPISILLFYTLTNCKVAVSWAEIMHHLRKSCPEYLYPSICLSDHHIFCKRGETLETRLIVRGENEYYLEKFYEDLKKMDQNLVVGGRPVSETIKFLDEQLLPHIRLTPSNAVERPETARVKLTKSYDHRVSDKHDIGSVLLCYKCNSQNNISIVVQSSEVKQIVM